MGFNATSEEMKHNTNKRICDVCRHYYYKKDLIENNRGQFCRECHRKKFPKSKRNR